MLFGILLTFFLVFFNAFFVASEFAIVKVRQSQLELKIRSGSKLAVIVRHIIDHLDSYLSATQLGVTLASLGLGAIGQPFVATLIKGFMPYIGVEIESDTAQSIALPVAFLLITILHITFGELIPKSIAYQESESISLGIAIPLRVFHFIFNPFIWFLKTFANSIIKLLGFRPASEEEKTHSQEELRYLLEESSRTGEIALSEHELLENVFEFSDTPIKQIMVPRGKISGIEASLSMEQIIEIFLEQGYSRMPVYDKTYDNIIGIVYAKDILKLILEPDGFILAEIIHPAYFVAEEEKINKLLHFFQKNKIHIAIVLDEFGGTAGLVTIEDIIEELVGEIQDEYDEEVPPVEKIRENEYMVRASTAIDDANDFLPFPLPEHDDYETVGGLIISEIGKIPELYESIHINEYSCKIMKRSTRSIELVKLIYKGNKKENED